MNTAFVEKHILFTNIERVVVGDMFLFAYALLLSRVPGRNKQNTVNPRHVSHAVRYPARVSVG